MAASLITMPMQRSQAQLAPAICITLIAAAAVGGVVVVVKSCEPKYYCVRDEETKQQWCRITTRKAAQMEGWTIVSGPHKSAEACDKVCHTNLLTGMSIPLMYIERSTNLINWETVAQLQDDPEAFEWSETNSLHSAAFYRVRVE